MNPALASSVSKGTGSPPAFAGWRRNTVLNHYSMVLAAAVFAVVASSTYGASPQEGRRPQAAALVPRDGRELQVLFLGNSLTAGNDLASLVESMAAAGGIRLRATVSAPGGFSLEDHWRGGVARRLLAGARWDFVVLQQGPSSRLDSQVNLRAYAIQWANEARRHGAMPALYMVWPFQGQANGFELVSRSYRLAATASNSRILPAGEAWQEAIRRDAGASLYLADRLHPTPAGTYLAALVITQGLTGVPPRAVPARLKLKSGRDFAMPEDIAEKLRTVAAKTLGA
jgi:hypothetical protein